MEKAMVQKLAAAGVSAEIIVKLLLEDDTPAPEVKAAPEVETPKAAEPEKKAAEEAKQEAPKPASDPVLDAIKELTGAIYRSNIIRDGTDETELSAQDKANVILTSILSGRPDGKEK